MAASTEMPDVQIKDRKMAREDRQEYDGSTPARVNIVAIGTLAGADKAMGLLEKRQTWVKSRRVQLKVDHASTSDKAEKIQLVDEDRGYVAELPRITSRITLLNSKRAEIVSERAEDAEGYDFPSVE